MCTYYSSLVSLLCVLWIVFLSLSALLHITSIITLYCCNKMTPFSSNRQHLMMFVWRKHCHGYLSMIAAVRAQWSRQRPQYCHCHCMRNASECGGSLKRSDRSAIFVRIVGKSKIAYSTEQHICLTVRVCACVCVCVLSYTSSVRQYNSASSIEKHMLSPQIPGAEWRKGCQKSFYTHSEVATAAIQERPSRSM